MEREPRLYNGPLTAIDRDPKRKLWSAWHEAAHVVVVYARKGIVEYVTLPIQELDDGTTLNMTVAWRVSAYEDARAVCGAGAVIDRQQGPQFTSNPDEIACHSMNDREVLKEFMIKNGVAFRDDYDVPQEFERGVAEATSILARPVQARQLMAIRDYIHTEFWKGTVTLSRSDIEAHL